jgi:hypothetical protein
MMVMTRTKSLTRKKEEGIDEEQEAGNELE